MANSKAIKKKLKTTWSTRKKGAELNKKKMFRDLESRQHYASMRQHRKLLTIYIPLKVQNKRSYSFSKSTSKKIAILATFSSQFLIK